VAADPADLDGDPAGRRAVGRDERVGTRRRDDNTERDRLEFVG